MKSTFTVACPADNDDPTRYPDFTTPESVLCKVCSLRVLADKDPTAGGAWISVDFGALVKGDDEYFEGPIGGYIMAWLDAQDRFLPRSITGNITTPRFGKIAPSSTCCDDTKYTGVYAGVYPTGAAKVTIIPGKGQTGLPLGQSAAISDVSTGQAKVFSASVAFPVTSNDAAFEMLVKKAITNASTETKEDGTALSCQFWQVGKVNLTITTSRRLHEDERRLSTTKTNVTFMIMMADVASTAALNKATFAATLNSITADAGVTIPTLSETDIEADDFVVATYGSPSQSQSGAIYSSLAWTVFVLTVLAFFQ